MVTEYFNNGFNKADCNYYRTLIKSGYTHKKAKRLVIQCKDITKRNKIIEKHNSNLTNFTKEEIVFLEYFNNNDDKITQKSLLNWL